jgi:hypothetical protein
MGNPTVLYSIVQERCRHGFPVQSQITGKLRSRKQMTKIRLSAFPPLMLVFFHRKAVCLFHHRKGIPSITITRPPLGTLMLPPINWEATYGCKKIREIAIAHDIPGNDNRDNLRGTNPQGLKTGLTTLRAFNALKVLIIISLKQLSLRTPRCFEGTSGA